MTKVSKGASDLDAIPTLVVSLRHSRCGYRGPVLLDRWVEVRRGRLHGEGTCPYCSEAIEPWVWQRAVEAQGVTLDLGRNNVWDARRGGEWMIGRTRQDALRELLGVLPERRTATVRGKRW